MDVYSGSCFCGQVHFEAHGQPKRIGICHCFTCRKFTGAAFAVFAIYARKAVKTNGIVSEQITSEEGRRYRCRYCGGPVYEVDQTSSEIELPIGAFDRANLFEPTYELWTTRREGWLPDFHTTSVTYDKNRHGSLPADG